MDGETFYLLFGLGLSLGLVGIWIFLYARKRRESGEQVKYKMLDDDE